MGVISVGASLGVRAVRASAPPVQQTSTSNAPARRSLAPPGSTGASSTAANGRKKSARKRLGGSKRSAAASYSRSERSVAATASSSAMRRSVSPNAREAAAPRAAAASVTPSVSTLINTKKPIGRMVRVRTTMDPQRLAPHVIGVNGGKLNAIMSRARCSISYRKTPENEGQEDTFSMAFMISANTTKRVDDGVQLLQAVVESTEQQLRKYEKSGRSMEQEEREEHVDRDERQQQQEDAERQAQTRIQQVGNEVSMQQSSNRAARNRSRSRSAARDEVTAQQRHPKRRREEASAESSASKRGRNNDESQTRRSERRPARNEDEERKEDREAVAADAVARAEEERHLRDEREAFRIRLARTVMISRRLKAEATRARAQEILERDKYLRLRRKFEEMAHRKKVAEFVVKKQCSAMTSALSTTSQIKKKQCLMEIERLSVAHDACPPPTSRTLAPNLRAHSVKAKRKNAGTPRLAGLQLLESNLAVDDDLMRLVKKVQAFGKFITSGSIEPPCMENTGMQNDATPDDDTADRFDFPSEDADVCMDTTNDDPATTDASMEGLGDDNEVGDEEKSNPRRESFRSTWDLPGLTRDLNLIQDYSAETDCKLLRFLAGERQYFYLEPLIDSGISYSHDIERWLLTAHDIQILHRYLLKHGDCGKGLVLCAERLRALGNLVPPLSSSSSENPLIGEVGVFESSRHQEWSELQDKIVTLHSLALVAHMLGKHYIARQVIGSNRGTAHTNASHENLLDEGTLESDLFTYILRPIRSSAIESSLFDSLPISLVRETIEQCPEVVNHVLQWKGKEDVPEYLREIDPCEAPVSGEMTSVQGHPSSSYFLRNLLVRLTASLRDLDAFMNDLGAILKEKRPEQHKDNVNHVSLRRQRIIQHVNRLKSVTTHVIVENTKLQLHKWWVLFAENSCAWFDPDDVDEMDDRSYDKFTCLQDALYIWHNEALLYTAKDDFVDHERLEESSYDHTEVDLADSGNDTRARTSNSSPYTVTPRETNRTPMPREEEAAALLRLTPASMRGEIQGRPFTRDEAKKCTMTPGEVEKTRTQLEKSLAITRDLMSALGHAGPWRTHVNHSNTLKLELAKQVAIQKKLVKHQWARYYTKYQEFALSQTQKTTSDQVDEEKAPSESAETQPQGEPTSENGDDATAMAIDWTGVFDPDNDDPDVIEMKKLRHEITLAKDQLLSDISGGGNKGSSATSHSPSLNTDQKTLVEECQGLASSCMQALGKFLGIEETDEATTTPVQKAAAKHPRSAKKPARAEKRAAITAKGSRTTRSSSSSDRRHSHRSKKASSKSSPASRSRRSESIRVAKALTASTVGMLIPSARSSGSRSSSSRAMSVRSNGKSRGQRSDDNSPLRMGCSGCRDLRRRCTGCSGCCLHCVCVSCGCRMCCSSRDSAVQKIMVHMLDLIESNEACKWMSNASAGNEGQHCGMLFFCQQCHCCEEHCPCLLAGSASEAAVDSTTTAPAAATGDTDSPGFIASLNAALRGSVPPPPSRRERRFKINPVAAQRRGPNLPTDGIFEGEEATAASGAAHGGANGHARYAHGGRGPLPTFDYGIEGAFGPMDQRGQCRTWRPAPSDKNEQEDLFRAARVRMKLVRSVFAKSSASGSECLDGEQLWQPERIRMMWERRDFHGVLGLPRDATTQQIKRQYRKLALKLHPDKASDTSASLESTVAEAGKSVGTGSSGKRVDAFVAATHSYKILLGDVDAMHGLGMDVNRIFSAEQIAVPPDLPGVLKDWTKAVIRENPADLLAFSQQWFQDKAAQVSQRKAQENQIRRMRQLFESYDVDGQGRMEAKDLGKFLGEDLGMDGYEDGSPAELLEDLAMELDPDNTGFVELNDIIQWYQQR